LERVQEFAKVTFESLIKLSHGATGFKLHSHKIPYGSGSGQQSVTAFPNADDVNSNWVVKPAYGINKKRGYVYVPQRSGQPKGNVPNGSKQLRDREMGTYFHSTSNAHNRILDLDLL
jgi:hypothetical protein